MKKIILDGRSLLLLVAALIFSLSAQASPKRLVIPLPSGWVLQVSEVKDNVLYQQRAQRRDGKDVQHLQLTAMQPVRKPKNPGVVNDKSIKKLAESLRDSVLKISTDKTIALQKLPSGRGYYFIARDANAKPRSDEYPQLVQGVLIADDSLINFTLLTHDANSSDAKAALAALDGVAIK